MERAEWRWSVKIIQKIYRHVIVLTSPVQEKVSVVNVSVITDQ